MDAALTKAYRAFRAHGENPVKSLLCARAERSARAMGAYVVWESDYSIDHVRKYGYDTEPESCEMATLYDADGVEMGSVGCVDDADDHYRRVIEADLFVEYLPAPGDMYVI